LRPDNAVDKRADLGCIVLPEQARQAHADIPSHRDGCCESLDARVFASVELVIGKLRANKRNSRFTLRGEIKAHGQRRHFALVYNIEKPASDRKAA